MSNRIGCRKRRSKKAGLLFAAVATVATNVSPAIIAPAAAATRLELALAAAAGRAAGRVASHAVANAVLRRAARYRGPACHAGARELRLRGLKHAIFVRECLKML
jgi:hypothetical protein